MIFIYHFLKSFILKALFYSNAYSGPRVYGKVHQALRRAWQATALRTRPVTIYWFVFGVEAWTKYNARKTIVYYTIVSENAYIIHTSISHCF